MLKLLKIGLNHNAIFGKFYLKVIKKNQTTQIKENLEAIIEISISANYFDTNQSHLTTNEDNCTKECVPIQKALIN